jgi:hypothetical protein
MASGPITLGLLTAASVALALSTNASGPARANEVITAVPVFAQDNGELGCESWTSLRLNRTARTEMLESWAFGYASAYVSDHAAPPGLRFTKEELLPLIDAQCRPELHNNYLWAAIASALEPIVKQAASAAMGSGLDKRTFRVIVEGRDQPPPAPSRP